MSGVICLRNQKAILRFLAPFLKSLLLSRSVALCSYICFRLLSRLRSMSKDSVMILFTSISSWFSLSRFSFALWSLNSFFFFKITRSTKSRETLEKSQVKCCHNTDSKVPPLLQTSHSIGEEVIGGRYLASLQVHVKMERWVRASSLLTEAYESVLAFNGFNLGEIVDIAGRPIRVPQLVLEAMGNFLEKDEDQFVVVLSLRNGQVNDTFASDETRSKQGIRVSLLSLLCHNTVVIGRVPTIV